MTGISEITLNAVNINELLRSPLSIYKKRTIKNGAENFIIEEAEGLNRRCGIRMIINLSSIEDVSTEEVSSAIHRHFSYRKERSRKKLKSIIQYGWRTLLIALCMLAFIFFMTGLAGRFWPDNRIVILISESFIILGWVALWRPMESLLYDWYPVKRDIELYQRLENCSVQINKILIQNAGNDRISQ